MMEDRTILRIVAIIALGVVLVAGISAGAYVLGVRHFANGGYVECAIAGLEGGRWCKP